MEGSLWIIEHLIVKKYNSTNVETIDFLIILSKKIPRINNNRGNGKHPSTTINQVTVRRNG